MNYIYSTLTSANVYPVYKREESGVSTAVKNIKINGGCNVIKKTESGGLHTPRGVVTPVSDEDLALLMQDKIFNLHIKNGFITIDKKNIPISKVVNDMEARDSSAPLTEETIEKEKKKKEKK